MNDEQKIAALRKFQKALNEKKFEVAKAENAEVSDIYNEVECHKFSGIEGPYLCVSMRCRGLPCFKLRIKKDLEYLVGKHPELQTNLTKENEMSNNSKVLNGINIQQKDRIAAASQIHAMALRLTKGTKPDVFYDDNACVKIFNEVVSVPVRVTCLESGGERKVFVNAFEITGSKLDVVVSNKLIECFSKLSDVVDEIDKSLGCENLSKLASDAL